MGKLINSLFIKEGFVTVLPGELGRKGVVLG